MRILMAIGAALAVMGAALAVTASNGDGGPGTLGPDDMVPAATLVAFDDCGQLLDHYRETALELVGPYGLGGGSVVVEDMAGVLRGGVEAGDSAMSAEAPAGAAAVEAVGPGPTGTNVQEAGVDEPDLVKATGGLLLAIADGALQVVEAGRQPRLLASLPLPRDGEHELLVDGDRALVLSRSWGGGWPLPLPRPLPEPVPGRPSRPLPEPEPQPLPEPGPELVPTPPRTSTSTLTAVDLTDPADPRVTATLTLDGDYRSARLLDGVARIVVASQPSLPLVNPSVGGLRAERTATQHNRGTIRDLPIENWLPWSVLSDGDGRVLREGPLLGCDQVRRPEDASGLSLLSVLSLDLNAGLEATDTTGVLADGETVYASASRLYVATTEWGPRGATGTQVHAFDLSDPRMAPYLASGRVEGSLLSSYALSAHEDHLRVAVTRDPGVGVGEVAASESAVVVLAERGEALVEVGRVDGLGRTERIHVVRFLGDLATVVTFRQTDPLYTIDLSDPTAPGLLGELKIPGYSAYLHPVGDDRLLGVGQDATEDGMLRGVQASLFDLADLSAPARTDTVDLGGGWSEVEQDAHAFLYWPPERLAVFPVDGEAVALRVDGDRLVKIGTVRHERGAGQVRRALVTGDILFTVSETGVQASDLTGLSPTGFAAFR